MVSLLSKCHYFTQISEDVYNIALLILCVILLLATTLFTLQVSSVIFVGNFVLTAYLLRVAAMVTLTKSICWRTVVKSQDINGIGVVIYQKPTSNSCYLQRKTNDPHLCSEKDGSRFPWYVIACPIFLVFVSLTTDC
jgi:hypothetical protein